MLSAFEHQTAYVPLYVTPLLSVRNPAPQGSQTAMYAVAIEPLYPLQVGDAVHLHLLSFPPREPGTTQSGVMKPVATPLEIKGRISGERERDELEVEFVIRNDEEDTDVRRVFVRAGVNSCTPATPMTSDVRYGLRRPNLHGGQEWVADREVDKPWQAGWGGPTQTPILEAEGGVGVRNALPDAQRILFEQLGVDRRMRSAHRQSDRGRWVVYAPPRKGAKKLRRVEGSRPGPPAVAPGPTQRIPTPWDAPRERSRTGIAEGVGSSNGRNSETPARGPKDLCTS
ncbi:uncharacterized protein TRAVEDRAFT_17246 [Trametes versicolor FP-101664 SS1]|uniref:uncharacterized protein n=1 Tax=Trametes versicolor (strain FP-101664) TaxID=717944 RepID=UPI00046221FF|nr:uncharacterized protein TRAVEDRAFT_17246 [Trametes versicolor FP-101664 SS1]EIW62620.1 hypothetical protein TRAVEDRAFT_17246 [Trametes versicolor FP-101664 SS1]